MSHKHWCDYEGHYWDCEGMATRLFQAEPTVCMCLQHLIPMEQGDHSECSIELLSCPEHRTQQMLAMGYSADYVLPREMEDERNSMFRDKDGNRTVGFCLWCGCDFYTFEEHEAHVADGMAACAIFQEYRDKTSTPPLLEMMLDEKDDGDAQ